MLYVFTRKKIQKMNERNESIAILGELISINDPSNKNTRSSVTNLKKIYFYRIYISRKIEITRLRIRGKYSSYCNILKRIASVSEKITLEI